MVKVIMGLKGSGKTKELIESIQKALAEETGSVVCIEKGDSLRYDISYRARLIDATEYELKTIEQLKGFVSGLHAGNFDITHVFIDSLYKIIGKDAALAGAFCQWCDSFGAKNDMNFTITISDDPTQASETLRNYL